jgi:hypothetical protein
MNYVPAWDRLLASLKTWASPREVPGGIEVSYVDESGTSRTVQIVMSPNDWDELAEVIGIESPDRLRRRLLALPASTPYLVCDSGVELIASATKDLPPDDFTPEPGGQWVVTDREGNVISRLADWSDDDR